MSEISKYGQKESGNFLLIFYVFLGVLAVVVLIWWNIGIILSYLMVLAGLFTIISFWVKKMIKNIANSKKTLYAIAVFTIVGLLSYFIASNEVLDSYERYNITTSVSKQVGMGLYFFYIIFGIAIITMFVSQLLNLLKITLNKNGS